jgi:hypothetical protein
MMRSFKASKRKRKPEPAPTHVERIVVIKWIDGQGRMSPGGWGATVGGKLVAGPFSLLRTLVFLLPDEFKDEPRQVIGDPRFLPVKLSALIKVSAEDLAAMARVEGVGFNVSVWIDNYPSEKRCTVCIAGATILRRGLVTDPVSEDDEHYGPIECEGNESQLRAIDTFRSGSVQGALVTLATVPEPRHYEALERMGRVIDSLQIEGILSRGDVENIATSFKGFASELEALGY